MMAPPLDVSVPMCYAVAYYVRTYLYESKKAAGSWKKSRRRAEFRASSTQSSFLNKENIQLVLEKSDNLKSSNRQDVVRLPVQVHHHRRYW